MNLLLDTHIFLWHISGDARMATLHRDSIQDPANMVFLSAASVWEAVIKHATGKLPLPLQPAVYLPQQRQAHRIDSLPVEESSLAVLANLPSLHRDPFDRMLVAQAIHYGLTLVTVDPLVKAYQVAVLPEV
jgi:PIN domain nuclease of toxin-antitoxin system